MSGKDNKDDEGSGFLGKLFMVGAGALVGAVATLVVKDLMEEPHSSSSNGRRPSGPRPGPKRWSDDDLKKRKQNRTKVQDKHVPSEMRCIICLDNPKEIITKPCNHVCMCEDCSERIKDKCPMCNQRIQGKEPIYL